jgi:hypothetical protein
MNALLTGQLIGRIGNSTVEFDGEQWWSDDEETADSLNQSLRQIPLRPSNLKEIAEQCCAAAGYPLVIINLDR